MKKTILLTLLVLSVIVCCEGRKTSKSRSSGSGRSSSKKASQPAPTSFSNPQPTAPKPSLFGWQGSPAQPAKSYTSWQSKPSSNGHSYPSSQTGLSGNSQPKPSSTHQESIQRNNAPQSFSGQQTPVKTPTNNQPGQSYPSSNGLSGSGSGYPQQQGSGLSGNAPSSSNHGYPSQTNGLSGSGAPHSGYPSQSNGLSGSGTAHSGYPQQHSNLPGSGVAPPPYSGYNNPTYPKNNYANNNYHPQGPPPPYSGPGYGGYGGHGYNNPGPQMPGYFGNYGSGFGGPSRTSTALKGVGIAGAGVGTLLTGLALWNLARSTGQHRHTVIYDNRGQPVAVAPSNDSAVATPPDSFLADLANCSLTISSENATEVLAIPCAIATSFSPDADVKDSGVNSTNDNTKCTVTVVTKTGKEYMTTIPCSILLNTAAENNVTEPPIVDNTPEITNGSVTSNLNEPTALSLIDSETKNNVTQNCTPQPGEIRDPINPCFAVTQDLTVIPLEVTDKSLTTPNAA